MKHLRVFLELKSSEIFRHFRKISENVRERSSGLRNNFWKFSGGAVFSWLVRSTPERAVRVRALAGDIVLCSWARHFTLTVPLSTQAYKWVPANLMLGVTLRWTSIPSNVIRTLTYHCLRICSSPCLLQSALDDLKMHLSRNGYPRGIISYNMDDVVNFFKHRNKPGVITTVPKKQIFIVLSNLGIQSKIVTQQLKSCIFKVYGCFNPKIIFRNARQIKSFFPYKDRLSRSLN